jgi:hypothetical protein
MLIGVAASTSSYAAYAIDVISVQRLFYNQDLGWFADIMLLFTTQCLGYGIAGLLRTYLVKPSAMIWPSTLVLVTLYQTLHRLGFDGGDSQDDLLTSPNGKSDGEQSVIWGAVSPTDYDRRQMSHFSIVDDDRSDLYPVSLYSASSPDSPGRRVARRSRPTSWRIGRLKFFVVVFACVFLWQILPGYIAPVLTSMALLCWMNTQNPVLRTIGSGNYGLGKARTK